MDTEIDRQMELPTAPYETVFQYFNLNCGGRGHYADIENVHQSFILDKKGRIDCDTDVVVVVNE